MGQDCDKDGYRDLNLRTSNIAIKNSYELTKKTNTNRVQGAKHGCDKFEKS
jgi:hypothetical protein